MKISDIDRIYPEGYDRITLVFKDCSKITTTEVTFLEDGTLEFGYIYEN